MDRLPAAPAQEEPAAEEDALGAWAVLNPLHAKTESTNAESSPQNLITVMPPYHFSLSAEHKSTPLRCVADATIRKSPGRPPFSVPWASAFLLIYCARLRYNQRFRAVEKGWNARTRPRGSLERSTLPKPCLLCDERHPGRFRRSHAAFASISAAIFSIPPSKAFTTPTPSTSPCLVPYFIVLVVLASYGMHRYRLVYLYFKYRKNAAKEPPFRFAELPKVTIQLPIFNEQYVIDRLVDCVCKYRLPNRLA